MKLYKTSKMKLFDASKTIEELDKTPKMKIQIKQQISGWKFSTNGHMKKINLKIWNAYHLKNLTLITKPLL